MEKLDKESRGAMKARISIFLLVVLLLVFCLPQSLAEYVPKPHSEQNSGNQADYAGTWIIPYFFLREFPRTAPIRASTA